MLPCKIKPPPRAGAFSLFDVCQRQNVHAAVKLLSFRLCIAYAPTAAHSTCRSNGQGFHMCKICRKALPYKALRNAKRAFTPRRQAAAHAWFDSKQTLIRLEVHPGSSRSRGYFDSKQTLQAPCPVAVQPLRAAPEHPARHMANGISQHPEGLIAPKRHISPPPIAASRP